MQMKLFKKSLKPKTNPNAIDHELRKYLLGKLQNQHLGADLCSLSDIFVDQQLYSHPLNANANELQEDEPLFFREALSISDVPELALEFPLPKISLEQALSGGCNIAISGGIGTGKTSNVAQFGVNILEKRCNNPIFHDYLPIFIHSLNFISGNPSSLIELLAQLFLNEGINYSIPEISKLIVDYLDRNKLCLLIDGLDELNKTEFESVVKQLEQIHREHPQILMVTTCGPYYTGGLETAGFRVLPIIPPGKAEKQKALTLWLLAWEKISAGIHGNNSGKRDSKLTQLWINQAIIRPSFSEITFMILAALYHDVIPNNQPIIPYLRRKTIKDFDGLIIENLITAISSSKTFHIHKIDFINHLSSLTNFNTLKTENLSDFQLNIGLLSSHGDQLRFSNPSIACYLLSISQKYVPTKDINLLSHSPIDNLITLYSDKDQSYILDWMSLINQHDNRTTSMILNHLFFSSNPSSGLDALFPRLIKLIVATTTPLSTKIKLSAIIYYANPAIFSQLLSKLETLAGSDFQKICAFFYSFYPINDHLPFFAEILGRKDESVMLYAIRSLLASSSETAYQFIIDFFRSNPESVGRNISELCSQFPDTGYQLLKEILKEENSTLRRFAPYGLRLINNDWADQTLRDLSINDNAWMIRDFAAQALHNKIKPEVYVPQRLSPLAENSTILKAANRLGLDVPSSGNPMTMLSNILEHGLFNEKIAALTYLLVNPNEESIRKIITLTSNENPLSEIASRALYEISLRV